jgi:hypothetical protein
MKNGRMENKGDQYLELKEEVKKLVDKWVDEVTELSHSLSGGYLKRLKDIDKQLYDKYDDLRTSLFLAGCEFLDCKTELTSHERISEFIKFADIYMEFVTFLEVEEEDVKGWYHKYAQFKVPVALYSGEEQRLFFSLQRKPNPDIIKPENWFRFCRTLNDQMLESLTDERIGRISVGKFLKPYVDFVKKEKTPEAVNNSNVEKKPFSQDDEISEANVFRRENEVWIIRFNEDTFKLRHIKGLSYIAFLISRPTNLFNSSDLRALTEGL